MPRKKHTPRYYAIERRPGDEADLVYQFNHVNTRARFIRDGPNRATLLADSREARRAKRLAGDQRLPDQRWPIAIPKHPTS